MPILLIIGIMAGFFISKDVITRTYVPTVVENQARSNAMKHDLLMMSARNYVAKNPTVTGTKDWALTQKQMTSSVRSTKIPNNWRVVIYQPGKFVLCTPSSIEESNRLMSRDIRDAGFFLNSNGVMVAAETRAEAIAKAGLCN